PESSAGPWCVVVAKCHCPLQRRWQGRSSIRRFGTSPEIFVETRFQPINVSLEHSNYRFHVVCAPPRIAREVVNKCDAVSLEAELRANNSHRSLDLSHPGEPALMHFIRCQIQRSL